MALAITFKILFSYFHLLQFVIPQILMLGFISSNYYTIIIVHSYMGRYTAALIIGYFMLFTLGMGFTGFVRII